MDSVFPTCRGPFTINGFRSGLLFHALRKNRFFVLNKASLSRTSSAYSDAFIIFLTAKENNFFHKIRGNFSILFTFSERLYTISSHFPFLVYRASKEPVRICQSDIPNGLFLFFNFYGSAMPQHPQTASYTDLHRIHLPRAALRDFPARWYRRLS